MTNPPSDILEALARRCEEAEAGSRELDVEITLLAYPYKSAGEEMYAAPSGFGRVVSRASGGAHRTWQSPRYSASLDATMSLIPSGWGRIEIGRYIGCGEQDGMYWCSLTMGDIQNLSGDVDVENCATPALALCAASLRALAAKDKGNE